MSATKILIVEDELLIARTLSKKLQKMGYEVSGIVSSAEAALQSLSENFPHLILMDIVIKGEKDGIQAAAEIYQLYDLPIIYLTAYADDSTLQRAEETGCYGYILKPYLEKELYATIRMALKKHDQTKALKQDGIVDSLTGLFNRRHMDQCLQEELERAVRNKSCFCFMLIDIDHFKSFNDLFGHLAGDLVLQKVAALIKDGMRRYDTVFRYGGEEIAVICPESALEDIAARADQVRLMIAQEEMKYQSSILPPVTVSIGIAAYPNHSNGLIEQADKALYTAKNQGRNQVVTAS